jgi:DNA-binding CsgD family transcriptional regulator
VNDIDIEQLTKGYRPPAGMICRNHGIIERERKVIKARLAGRSNAEIAAKLKIPVAEVAAIIERAASK